ncbi:hypothetical protein O181_018283 [Austropuccinia psidii MF-1]|uniref:Reverse transcriptase domain-containing protein n=1 Tax=Austropuccinia psidii MF-1 TaxID=1389203 RepID=A0A9Q3GSK0_9BASI|nr:hypothetical protein [Austropuccinia psidii MF-1]
MVHMKILKKCGGELEHSLRGKCIEPCSTEEYINALEDIVTRTKIGRTWKKVDIKSRNKQFIKKDKQRETFEPNTPNSNKQRKCHKCGGKDNHNDKEEESDSEKATEESEASESDEINVINAQINNIYLNYEVLDFNSNLPQVGTFDTSLTKIQDAKLYRTKTEKGMGYSDGNSSKSIVIVENQEARVNLDTGAYCTCVGKSYFESIIPDWEGKLIPIREVKFSSESESMKPLGIIELTLIFPHPSQCIRLKVDFVVMNNCTNNHFILGNNYFSIYGIDISNQKDIYFTIGDNKRQKFGFLNNKKQIIVIKKTGFNQELTEKLIYLLFKYKNALATDKEPLGAIIGNEEEIILNLENPYPPLLRRPAYPASPRAREALEVHIEELMDLGILRNVRHNEQVELTTPFIITWNNGKSRMVGEFRDLITYTISDRYPIPRIHETLTELFQAKLIKAMDSHKVFHQNVLTDNAKKLLRIIVHCGIYEYLRMLFGIKNAPSHYQRMMNTIFPEELSELWLII